MNGERDRSPLPALLLAAFPPELAGLDRTPPRGYEVSLTGVGALAAAVSTTRALERGRFSRVLFLGTCGAYDARLGRFDLLCASEVIATSREEILGGAFRPQAEIHRWTPGYELPLPGYAVAVPGAITGTEEGSRALARVAAAEHLELAGVFAACAAYGVPVAAALAVANRVGPEAHSEWMANHAEASMRLVGALRGKGILS